MRAWHGYGVALSLTSIACGAEPRGQLLIHVDTDMPLVAELGDDTSADAAIDSIRIDVLDANLKPIDSRVIVVFDSHELPLSFGVPKTASKTDQVLVRVRAFRAMFSVPGEFLDRPTLDPRPEVTVDRLLLSRLPDEGVEDASITLHGECIGVRAEFGLDGDHHSCLDASRRNALASEGISRAEPGASVTNGWTRARVTPCVNAGPAGTRCIPGGLMVFGDPLFLAISDIEYDSLPLRVVEVSPFHLDETEVTVGAIRALVDGGYTGPLPLGPNEEPECTWDPASPDDLPVGCVTHDVASSLCEARGGVLPSEVQWEWAARGRGKRWLYPWGNQSPECCSANLSHGNDCPNGSVEPVGSHRGSETCTGDVSLDGVVDLAGSLHELMRDAVSKSLDDPCWGPTEQILVNPVCEGGTTFSARGGSWLSTFGDATLPFRRSFFSNQPRFGFRCAYASLE